MEQLQGLSDVQGTRGHYPFLSQAASDITYDGGSRNSNKHADTPSSSSTNFPSEPSWLEDLLNEPETPVMRRRHRRSISDSFAWISGDIGGEESWLGNTTTGGSGPAWGFQTHQYFNNQPPLTRKLSAISEERDNNVTTSVKVEDEVCKGLLGGFSCQQSSEMPNHASGSTTNSSEDSNGSQSQTKPSVAQPASKPDGKQKQHNARRSRARKLQYIAELERNVQALQVEGAAVSAQLEFLDQQNILLVMENRALKQRLESLSHEHLIKTMEQEILDRELGRLQYLYHVQNSNPHQHQRNRPKQKAAVHRRGRSCDLDCQFSRLNLHSAESITGTKGSP